MTLDYAQENIWFDKWRYDDAERHYYEKQSAANTGLGTLANQIAKAREEIQNSLAIGNKISSPKIDDVSNNHHMSSTQCAKSISQLEKVVAYLNERLTVLENLLLNNDKTVPTLEKNPTQSSPVKKIAAARPAPPVPTSPAASKEEEDDDDVDLFGSDDEEDEEAARVREERLKSYAEKKAKKPGPIAKSSVLLDCKPWDDETDMGRMEQEVRKIEMDGLLWGASKLVPLAYGIRKLSILCTVEDEKVSIDDLIEKITSIEDYVQSVDIGAFNKI